MGEYHDFLEKLESPEEGAFNINSSGV